MSKINQVFASGKVLSQRAGVINKILRIMKITAFLLTVVCLHAAAGGHSQTITISEKSAPLEKIFTEIKKQTGYEFVYRRELLQSTQPVDIDVKNATVKQVLDICFKDQRLEYKIVDNLIVLSEKTEQKEIKPPLPLLMDVTGKITDTAGNPLMGTYVRVKGANNNTITNERGEFTLQGVDENATLIITNVSHETQEIKLNGRSAITVQLKIKITELSAVAVTVNTGYQEITKERATGSFTLINNSTYNQLVTTDVLSRLQYMSNGYTVLSQRVSSIQQPMIRGLSTISGPTSPLIILDNFPYEGSINNINPNDVENVTFLKDAAAASIWGSKAGNGVIVITTKKGRFNQTPKIEFSNTITVIDKPDLFYLNNMSTSDFIDVERFLFSKQYRFSDTASASKLSFSQVYEILFKRTKGLISAVDSASQIDALRKIDLRDEFNKYMYQKAINQQYSINIRGGSNNFAWIISSGYDKNISDLDAKYNRVNVRFNNTYKVTKNLEINSSVYYTQSKSINGRPAYGSITSPSRGVLPLYTKLADSIGNSLPAYIYLRKTYLDTVGNGKLLDWKYYPLDDYKHVSNTVSIQDFNAVLGFNYKLFNFLNIDIKYHYQKQQSELRVVSDMQSYFTRNLVNTFTKLSRTNAPDTFRIPKNSILDLTNGALTNQNIRAQLNFDQTYRKHKILALVGTNVNEQINQGYTYRTYGYNNDILISGNVDYTNTYPTFITGSSGFIPNINDFNKTNTRFVSFYGNAAYSYDRKYVFSLSGRRDASNIFGVSTNDKWSPLWSTGISWDISDENFYKVGFLSYLKLRTTYGFSGNIDPSRVAVTTLQYSDVNPYTFTPITNVNNIPNPNLRWEKVRMINFGLDFKSKKSRITGSIEYYRKKSTDLYTGVPVDPTTGIGSATIIKNVGSMKAHGFDVELNSINVDKQFKWVTNFLINTFKSKVINRYNSSFIGNAWVGSGVHPLENYPLYTVFAYKWAGLDDTIGAPRGYTNGQVSKDYNAITGSGTQLADLVYAGSSIPLIYGSIGNSFTWKNISLITRITYKFKYFFIRESINYSDLFAQSKGHSDFAKRWQKPGDENITNVPAMIYPVDTKRETFYNYSEALVTKGDHIRFQYISISYNLNKSQVKRLPFENMQIYTVVNNLGILWTANKEGIDPDYSGLPPSKSASLGIRVTF